MAFDAPNTGRFVGFRCLRAVSVWKPDSAIDRGCYRALHHRHDAPERTRGSLGVVLAVVAVVGAVTVVVVLVLVVVLVNRLHDGDADREGFASIYPAQLSHQDQERFKNEDMHTIARLRRSLQGVNPVFAKIQIYPSAHQSYTDKKRRIFLRLRDKSGQLYPDRVLRLVLAHEFSHHISTSEWGHGPVFTENFARVLRKARELGVDIASESEVPPGYIHPTLVA